MSGEWFDKNNKRAAYKQLYDYIVQSINDGVYRDGERLPARRDCAEEFNTSETTVSNAYKLLENTGYIYSVPRKGYFAKSPIKVKDDENNKKTKIFVDGRYVDERIAFSYNGTDNELFNRSSYAKIVREIAYNDGKDILRLGNKYGEQILRNAISKYLYSFRRLKCDPSKIIIGAGGEYMLVSLAAVLKRGFLFAVESPGEMRPYYTLEDYGFDVTTIPSGKNGDLRAELEKASANAFYCFPSYHFPDGYVMTDKQKQELIAWTNETSDRYIIEDDRDFGIIRHKNKPLFEMSENGRVIYFGTFMHSISSAFKLSYMVLPDELFTKWIYHHRYYHSLCTKLEQYALAEFIGSGEYVKHYRTIRDLYKERRKYFKDLLEAEFGSAVKVLEESDSTSVIAEFNIGLDGSQIRRICAASGIKMYNISMYTPKAREEYEPPVFIFGIGHLDKRRIKFGVEALKEALIKYIK